MNRITRETIEKLDLIKGNTKDDELIELLDRFKGALNYENNVSTCNYLLDAYDTIKILLFEVCKLNHREAGFIFNKVMQYNFAVNKNNNFFIIDSSIFQKNGISVETAKKILDSYINNTLNLEELNIVNKILKDEQIRLKHIKNAYKFIENFSKNTNHTALEYELLESALSTIKVPKELIISYILYFKDREVAVRVIKPKEIVIEEKDEASRRYYKNRYKELYKEDAKEAYFDMKDIKEFMDVLKKLNLPDEKISSILTNLYNFVLENNNYYDFLIDKSSYMNYHMDTINEIINLKDAYKKADDESKTIIIELLIDLYKTLKPVMTKSFDYEMNLNSKVKEKV